MNKFKRVAIGLAVTGAMAFSGAASAESYLATVDWESFSDVNPFDPTGFFGTLSGGNYIHNPDLNNNATNDTGYRVLFTGDAHSTNQVTLAGLLGVAGAGFEWQYVNSEWRGGSGAFVSGSAQNNTGFAQTMDEMAAQTRARIGFGSYGASELASALAIAGESFFEGVDPTVDLTPGEVYNFTQAAVLDDLDPWVASSDLQVFARGNASNSQVGGGNIDFTVTNRANFYVEQRHNYEKVSVGVPESGTLAMVGLGLSLIGFQSVARKRKQA